MGEMAAALSMPPRPFDALVKAEVLPDEPNYFQFQMIGCFVHAHGRAPAVEPKRNERTNAP
jgi:hypothetical protein